MTQEISGVLIVDKPGGITSARLISRIKRISGVNKIGHAGTLDPMATGLMICPVNRATRLSRFFLESPKTYAALLRLGVDTDTQDATGTVIAERPLHGVSEETFRAACLRFVGEIDQTPPAYSALKHRGIPLYKYARKGAAVVKASRKVRISAIRVLEMNFPDVRIEVDCSAGTYIRTLCADIGAALGCGGHLAELRRTACGGFAIAEAVSLAEIESHAGMETLQDLVIPMSDALRGMPSHAADGDLTAKIGYGKPITAADMGSLTEQPTAAGGLIKIVDAGDRLLAVVTPDESRERYNYCCVFFNP